MRSCVRVFLAQLGVVSDNFGVLLAHFGVILDKFGVVWDTLRIRNVTQKPQENRIFTPGRWRLKIISEN